VDARKVADAKTAWQERLARLQEEEEALWAPTTEQPAPTQPQLHMTPPPCLGGGGSVRLEDGGP